MQRARRRQELLLLLLHSCRRAPRALLRGRPLTSPRTASAPKQDRQPLASELAGDRLNRGSRVTLLLGEGLGATGAAVLHALWLLRAESRNAGGGMGGRCRDPLG